MTQDFVSGKISLNSQGGECDRLSSQVKLKVTLWRVLGAAIDHEV
jgi:hypothetical protein